MTPVRPRPRLREWGLAIGSGRRGPRHLPPGQGDLDWLELFRAIHVGGYGGPFILELAHVEALQVLVEARRFVRRLWRHVESEGDPTPA